MFAHVSVSVCAQIYDKSVCVWMCVLGAILFEARRCNSAFFCSQKLFYLQQTQEVLCFPVMQKHM